MEIKESVQITLTPDEVRGIIKLHFADQYKLEHISFSVNGVEDPDDWRSELPLSYEMTEVYIKGEKKGEKEPFVGKTKVKEEDERSILDRLTDIYFRKCYMGFGEVTEEDEDYISQEIICTPTGKGGYDSDEEYVKEKLEMGKEYTLDYMDVGQSSGTLYLKELPGIGFNTVCFNYKIK